MGVLPCQLKEALPLNGTETFDLLGLGENLKPRQELTLVINPARSGVNGTKRVPVICRIDTPIEVEYYRHGGILPYVLRQLIG
jgi:aconitate hydratase